MKQGDILKDQLFERYFMTNNIETVNAVVIEQVDEFRLLVDIGDERHKVDFSIDGIMRSKGVIERDNQEDRAMEQETETKNKEEGKMMKTRKPIKTANQIARQFGKNRATSIIVGTDSKVIGYIPFGYRKYTTGEYVSNKYRSNFGWKNTYYQAACCTVMINIENFY